MYFDHQLKHEIKFSLQKHAFTFGFLTFVKKCLAYRLISIHGEQGRGKTLFSVAFAHYFLYWRYVDHLVTNFPSSLPSVSFPLNGRNTLYLFDEAGRVFDNRSAYKDKNLNAQLSESIYSLRKRGSFVVYPSFLELDKKINDHSVRLTLSLMIPFFWRYIWEVGPTSPEERTRYNSSSGSFWLINPAALYGCYDTYYAPSTGEVYSFARQLASYKDEPDD